MEEKSIKMSDIVLSLARVYLFFAVGALVLYFVLVAIESHKVHVLVETRGYQVPIEPVPETGEVPLPNRKEARHHGTGG